MTRLRLNSASATPVYQQIVQQVRHLIESGVLRAGERLPSSRLLAQNLGVNRNTVAKAYGLLREHGLIETRGAAGTVVTADAAPVAAASAHDAARAVLAEPVRAALDLGIEPEEVARLALNLALRVHHQVPASLLLRCVPLSITAYFPPAFLLIVLFPGCMISWVNDEIHRLRG